MNLPGLAERTLGRRHAHLKTVLKADRSAEGMVRSYI